MGTSVSIVGASPMQVTNPNLQESNDAWLFQSLLGPNNIGAAGVVNALPVAANVIGGKGSVDAGIAIQILDNLSQGKPPFRPELGRVGGVSWFATQGNPYTGVGSAGKVTIPVEIKNVTGKPPLVFDSAKLKAIFDSQYPNALELATEQYRQKNNLKPVDPIGPRGQRVIAFNARNIAERQMWKEVGETVARSESGIGKVILTASQFSRSGDGEYTLTSRPEAVTVKGGIQTLINILNQEGAKADPALMEAAQKVASRENWVGRVRGVFRYGGRVMIVVGALADGYRIYSAQDRVKESVEVVGGWTGAVAAGSAFAAWYTPADAAGPWAWVGHGAGTLIAGGVGYFVFENVAKSAYELIVDDKPPIVVPSGM
jgi:hypothetical protein